jgi:hypothetical protein
MTLEAWVNTPVVDGWRTVVMKEQPGPMMVYTLYANAGTLDPTAAADGPSARVVVHGTENFTKGPSRLAQNDCPRATPCLTFDRAYHAAQPGEDVELAAGTYPLQALTADATKTAPADVTFRPASGAAVVVNGLDVTGSHITFKDFAIEGNWATYQTTDDVTFRNLEVHGGIYTQSSSNISIIGGSVGGLVNEKPQIGALAGTTNTNILIDGVRFHDVRSTDLNAFHVECLLAGGVDGLVIRHSRFENCDVFDLSIGEMNGTPSRHIVIENNFFAGANGTASLHLQDQSVLLDDVLVRNNSSPQEMTFAYGTPAMTNVRVVNNVAPMGPTSCDTRIVYSHNVWSGATCGPTDVLAPDLGFVDALLGELHLLPTSLAVDAGDPASFPSDDIDGQHRPLGLAPDAGASELR